MHDAVSLMRPVPPEALDQRDRRHTRFAAVEDLAGHGTSTGAPVSRQPDHPPDHLALEALRVEEPFAGDDEVGPRHLLVRSSSSATTSKPVTSAAPSAASPPARPPAAPAVEVAYVDAVVARCTPGRGARAGAQQLHLRAARRPSAGRTPRRRRRTGCARRRRRRARTPAQARRGSTAHGRRRARRRWWPIRRRRR